MNDSLQDGSPDSNFPPVASHIRVRVLMNALARNGAFLGEWPELRGEVLRRLNLPLEVLETVFPDSAEEMAQEVKRTFEAGVSHLILMGGDGTFSSAIQGIFELIKAQPNIDLTDQTMVHFFPGGRGNDFFRSVSGEPALSASEAREKALQLLRIPHGVMTDLARIRWQTDSGWVKERAFLNIASFGFTGTITDAVNHQADWLRKTPLGNSGLTYLAHALGSAGHYRREPLRVEVDGRLIFEGKVLLGSVLNGRFNGGGVCWSKESMLDDGELELVLIEGRKLTEVLRALPALRNGEWSERAGVYRAKGRHIRIERQGDHLRSCPFWETDGEQREPEGVRVTEVECMQRVFRASRVSQDAS